MKLFITDIRDSIFLIIIIGINKINILSQKIVWMLKASDYERAKLFYIEELFDSNKNRWWLF